jgi:dipeptidase
MCDTVVATREATVDGVTVFGKNSDREPNEAHHLLRVPAQDHPPGSRVKCTYIDIPQVEHTHAILLSKPFWIWGAEMGTNEHGVAIGNEAVFTRVGHEKQNGLIGMDLLRLALERATTARDALTVVIELLVEYGQEGNCGFKRQTPYHNSFIIADPHDAWVLETAERHWIAKQVQGIYTISNRLSIGDEWDLISPNLVSHAVEKGWCHDAESFHFARCYADRFYTHYAHGAFRRRCTGDLLAARRGVIDVSFVMSVLRDHGVDDEVWRPDRGLSRSTVCMHAGFGPIRYGQTTGSMVSRLHPDLATHFFTATAAPCTSVFKPAWVDAELPDTGPFPTATYDPATLFWRHEALHRATLRDYWTMARLYQAERDELEAEFIAAGLERAGQPVEERAAFSADCFARADAAEARWLERVSSAEVQDHPNPLYAVAWSIRNRQAKMPA